MVSVFVVVIAVLTVLFAYPNSPPAWKENPIRQSAPALIVVLCIYSLISLNRVATVDPVSKRMTITRSVLLVISFHRREFSLADIESVICQFVPDESFEKILRVFVHTNLQRIEIMRRFRDTNFEECIESARQLAELADTELITRGDDQLKLD